MAPILMLLAAVVATGGNEPAMQRQGTQVTVPEPPLTARERATNEALLAALKQKRAEIAQSPLPAGVHAESRHYALEFLDRQIEKVKRAMEQ